MEPMEEIELSVEVLINMIVNGTVSLGWLLRRVEEDKNKFDVETEYLPIGGEVSLNNDEIRYRLRNAIRDVCVRKSVIRTNSVLDYALKYKVYLAFCGPKTDVLRFADWIEEHKSFDVKKDVRFAYPENAIDIPEGLRGALVDQPDVFGKKLGVNSS